MRKSRKISAQWSTLLSLCLSVLICQGVSAQERKIRLNAFGDMTIGKVFGNPASQEAADLFAQYGESEYPFSVNKGFGIVGSDFVLTTNINEDLIFQAEVNLQVERGSTSEVELDLERVYLDYRLGDNSGVQIGLFFTPVGFINRNLYARAWLMNSVQIREIVEESTGLVPTHAVGMNTYGGFDLGNNHFLKYIFSVGNGRAIDPVSVFYNRNDGGLEYTGLFEWNIPGADDFRIGLSAFYNNEIKTFRVENLGDEVDITDSSAEQLVLSELGFNPYIFYKSKKINFIAESHTVQISDKSGNLAKSDYMLNAITAELAVNFTLNKKRIAPYVRYDHVDLDNEDPYYGLRADGDMLSRVYVPEMKAVMVGVVYDISAFNRFKIEYIRNLDGPRQENGIVFQTAFGF